jgi:hypothetical protein
MILINLISGFIVFAEEANRVSVKIRWFWFCN